MPWLFTCGNSREIPSVKDYLLSKKSNLYTTMRFSCLSGQVFELDIHLQRVKANEEEREMIKQILRDLPSNVDLRITLMRSDQWGVELIYEEMPELKIQSCQVEIRSAKRENVHEKNSQWIK